MASLKQNYRQVRSELRKIKSTLAFAAALPRFFRDPITVQRAEEEVKRLLNTRVERFLELARTQIYECPGSPYLKLLKHAGCEFSDLRAHIRQHGLEFSPDPAARAEQIAVDGAPTLHDRPVVIVMAHLAVLANLTRGVAPGTGRDLD